MLCDAHIHVGQFYDIYTSPEDLSVFLKEIGVDAIAVSSTTTCEENYNKVEKEIESLIKVFGKVTIPILWVTPALLNNETKLIKMLNHVDWKCIKVHPQLCPDEWDASNCNFKKAVELSKELKAPLMIHTGVVRNCHPCQLQPLFSKYPEQSFIMAHGRPIEEAISVMKECPNTYVDTAFMPIPYIAKLIKLGLSNRILWGSDYPIIKFHDPNVNTCLYYNNLIDELKHHITHSDYIKITQTNFLDVFNVIGDLY